MSVFMFPNASRLVPGAGAELFAQMPHITKRMSDILGVELCVDDERVFDGRCGQGIVFCLNALSLFERLRAPHRIDWTVGHSMGELNALHASGMVDLEDLLGWIRVTADEPLYAAERDSALAVVQGIGVAEVERILRDAAVDVAIACENSRVRVIVGGRRAELARLRVALRGHPQVEMFAVMRGFFAFHAYHGHRFEQPAQLDFLAGIRIRPPRVPFFSTILARPVSRPDDVRTILATVPFAPVRWLTAIEALDDLGMTDFEEIGFGTTLSALVRDNLTARRGTETRVAIPS